MPWRKCISRGRDCQPDARIRLEAAVRAIGAHRRSWKRGVRRLLDGRQAGFAVQCELLRRTRRREDLRREVESVLAYLEELELLPEIVTTASPFVAWTVKTAFPSIETRASVNMRIDSVSAMESLSDLFDSFHIRRDLQRDLDSVAKYHAWCVAHGKKLCMLVNSGCLRCCPFQTFHDNLLGHDEEVAACQCEGIPPHLCRKLYTVEKSAASARLGPT